MKISVKTINKLSYLVAGLLMVNYASAQNFTQQQQPFTGTVGKPLQIQKNHGAVTLIFAGRQRA